MLMLPISATRPSLSLIDAVFMAVSATCVTGLSVIDIGSDLSGFGQSILLILIQLGGLGIMTFSTLFIYLIGRKASIKSRDVIGSTLNFSVSKDIRRLIRRIMLLVVGSELMGAILLSFCFLPTRSVHDAMLSGFFHSVSAFCNAGFSLNPTSFECYSGHWPVNLILIFLIVTGGLGFVVLIDLKHRFIGHNKEKKRLSFHSKVVLSLTAGLLITGTLVLFVAENIHGTESGKAFGFLTALFQSVTARTAGFDTIPINQLSNASLFILMVLMFIGAAPGSCGGGIKVTTFGVLIMLLVSRLKGQEEPQLFNRSLSMSTINKVSVIALFAILIVVVGFLGLLITENHLDTTQHGHGAFEQLLFETISAYGTVGLSLGITPQLTVGGKMIIIFLMFVGRLGPLTVAVALSKPRQGRYRYATGDIMVG